MDTLNGVVSTDSDRNPGSSAPLGAQRVTSPEFAERTTAALESAQAAGADSSTPTFTAEAADASADSIRPSWEEPSFRMLRPLAERHLPARELTPERDRAGEEAVVASAPPPLLSADEADAYAARIQPSWAPPPAWSATPRTQVMPLMPLMSDPLIEQLDRDRVESGRTPVLRAALIVTGFALLGAAVGALLALVSRPEGSVPAVENTKLSALTVETTLAADRPSIQALPTAASSDTIHVRIEAEPARAKIFLDGVEVPNPFDARRPRGGRHRVLIRAKGRATRDLTLTFERDEHVRVSLDPPVPPVP